MDRRTIVTFLLVFSFTLSRLSIAQKRDQAPAGLPAAPPASIGLLPSQLKYIDQAVRAAIEAGELPGAVILVARQGKIGYLKAFGNRALQPAREPMTTDTIFDMASLTKVMATTPAIMLLAERGKIRLGDRVRHYLPEFIGGGKDSITLRQLLTHFSGLRPDFDLSVPWEGYSAAMDELWKESTRAEPGKEFVYSDLNFIALGEIVSRVSGQKLDRFATENFFRPLGMAKTTFNPPVEWRSRIAPTEPRARSLQYLKGALASPASDEMLRGAVHDPTSWRMGGVAGHAGLFSNARDVALYAQMLLNKGTSRGMRVLAPLTVRSMTSPQSPRESAAIRGFGWDIESPFSSPRGDLLGSGFGHTGFTGTSLWLHPETGTFLVILSNRLHPDGKGDVTRLRGVIANIVAGAITSPP
jgi:CubicO group peptidase (beta-lactamase class C family)